MILNGIECVQIQQKSTQLKRSETQVINFTSHRQLKIAFETQSLTNWCHLTDEFEILSEKTKINLLLLSTIYLCEVRFFIYTATKTKYKSHLNAEQTLTWNY